MGNSFPIEFVGNSNFNFIQHIQNIKFSQSNAVEQITGTNVLIISATVSSMTVYAYRINVQQNPQST